MNVRPVARPIISEEEDEPTTTQGTLEWYENEIKKRPRDIGLRYGKARLLMESERWEEARKELEELLTMDPDFAKGWDSLALCCQMLGDHEGALRCYENLERLEPDNEEILCEKGKTLLFLGKYDMAEKVFSEVLEINPMYKDAWLGRAEAIRRRAEEKLPHDPPEEIPPEKDRLVEESYDTVLSMDPNNIEAMVGKSSWKILKGEGEEGLKLAEKIVRLDPRSIKAWYVHGLAAETTGNEKLAEESFSKAASLEPRSFEMLDPTTFFYRGDSLFRIGKEEEALRCFEKILDMNRNSQIALMKKASLLEKMGRYQEAAETYERLVNLRPDDHYIWYLKGGVHRKTNDLENALESFDRSESLKPDFTPAIYSKGEVLYSMGRLDEAMQEMEKLLSLDPENNEGQKLYNAIHQALEKFVSQPGPGHPTHVSHPQKKVRKVKRKKKVRPGRREISGAGHSSGIDHYGRAAVQRGTETIGENSKAIATSDVDIYVEDLDSIIERLDSIENAAVESELMVDEPTVEKMDAGELFQTIELARALVRRKRFEEATELYEGAIKAAPEEPSLYVELARAYREEGDVAGALSALERCPVAHPNVLKEKVLLETDLLRESIDHIIAMMGNENKPAESDKESNTPLIRGRKGTSKGKRSGKSGFPGSIFRRRSSQETKMSAGHVSDTTGGTGGIENIEKNLSPEHLKELLSQIESLLSQTPSDPLLWYARGVVLYRVGNLREALSSMTRAIFLEPENPSFWEAKAEIFLAMNKKEQAEKCVERAAQLHTARKMEAEAAFGSVGGMADTDEKAHGSEKKWAAASDFVDKGRGAGKDKGGEWQRWISALFEEVDSSKDFLPCPHCGLRVRIGTESCPGCGVAFVYREYVEDDPFSSLFFFGEINDKIQDGEVRDMYMDIAHKTIYAMTDEKERDAFVVIVLHPRNETDSFDFNDTFFDQKQAQGRYQKRYSYPITG